MDSWKVADACACTATEPQPSGTQLTTHGAAFDNLLGMQSAKSNVRHKFRVAAKPGTVFKELPRWFCNSLAFCSASVLSQVLSLPCNHLQLFCSEEDEDWIRFGRRFVFRCGLATMLLG